MSGAPASTHARLPVDGLIVLAAQRGQGRESGNEQVRVEGEGEGGVEGKGEGRGGRGRRERGMLGGRGG